MQQYYRFKVWTGSTWAPLADFDGRVKMSTGSGTGNWRFVDFHVAGGTGTTKWDIPAEIRDTQTVTVGSYTQTTKNGSPTGEVWYGYYTDGIMGSISDGTSNVLSGSNIVALYYTSGGGVGPYLVFGVSGEKDEANPGWQTVRLNSIDYRLSDATYYWDGAYTTWTWSASSTNPFGTSGTKTVYFL